jgi:hypothetical protein
MHDDRVFFGDDLPKLNPWRHDQLGYREFSQNLSNIILSTKAPNGYVIGLHGKWGSGKSTTLNFIEAYLNKHNQESESPDKKITIIKFRPWIISGHQDLIAAFFKLFSEHLAQKEKSKGLKKVAKALKGSTGDLINAAAKIAMKFDPSYGIVSGSITSILKKPFDSAIEKFLSEPALQTAYDSLTTTLKSSNIRFLVTIDDLDRLEHSEIKTVMQMVKTVGQLPNVIYLLAYDRKIISRALDEDKTYTPKFSEKIVQLEVELPQPSRGSLLKILNHEIEFLTSNIETSSRLNHLVRDGIQRWINSPRDVLRLSNAIKLSWPAIKGEIDPLDLLIIEAMRLFDEHVFNWVRDNRDFIFSKGQHLIDSSELRAAVMDNLKSKIKPENRIQTIRLLSTLFPQSSKWLEEKSPIHPELHVEISRRRGIGCEAGYDTFFGLYPSRDEIPKSTIDSFFLELDSAELISLTIESYQGKYNNQGDSMIAKFLEEIRFRYNSRSPELPTQTLLEELIRAGKKILSQDEQKNLLTLSAHSQLSYLIRDLLFLWGKDTAGSHLLTAFKKIREPTICSDIFVDRGREFGTFASSNLESAVITPNDFSSLGNCLLEMIRNDADNDDLLTAPFYFDILRAWGHLDGWSAPKKWLEEKILPNPERFIKAISSLASYSIGTPTRNYSMRSMPDPNLYDLPTLIKWCEKHLQETTFSADEKNLVQIISEGSREYLRSITKQA